MRQPAAGTQCHQASLQVDEPLPGSAVANVRRWLLLEHPGQWERKALRSPEISQELGAWLSEAERQVEGLRTQLIRRPGGASGAGRRVFLAHSDGARPQLWARDLPSLDALCDVDASVWARGEIPVGFEPYMEPVYLVCVHGKRDRCCARLGMPVYTACAAREPGHVWQTSHLGGHRFAATLLCLPEGICYGRIEESEVGPLMQAHSAGRVHDLRRFRGRTCHGPVAQAAEAWMRERLGVMAIHELGAPSVERDAAAEAGERWRVSFQGVAEVVLVQRESLGPLVKSCGAEAERVAIHRCELEGAPL